MRNLTSNIELVAILFVIRLLNFNVKNKFHKYEISLENLKYFWNIEIISNNFIETGEVCYADW